MCFYNVLKPLTTGCICKSKCNSAPPLCQSQCCPLVLFLFHISSPFFLLYLRQSWDYLTPCALPRTSWVLSNSKTILRGMDEGRKKLPHRACKVHPHLHRLAICLFSQAQSKFPACLIINQLFASVVESLGDLHSFRSSTYNHFMILKFRTLSFSY